MIESLKRKKEIGPAAYPCNVAGFLCEMSNIIRKAGDKWDHTWNSSNFIEEAEALKFLSEEMLECVKTAIENGNKNLEIHSKS